jgi:hypothetical protein
MNYSACTKDSLVEFWWLLATETGVAVAAGVWIGVFPLLLLLFKLWLAPKISLSDYFIII